MVKHVWAVLMVVTLGVGCSLARPGEPSPTVVSANCPITRPVPQEAILPAAARPIIDGYRGPVGGLHLSMYGNDALWVVIPPDGEMTGVPDGSGIFNKFPTVRLIEGTLSAEGRRLDGPAPPASFSIGDGYGSKGFQAVGVTFPSEGCWAITYQLADRELSFVVRVRR